jgi:hypothetical protein
LKIEMGHPHMVIIATAAALCIHQLFAVYIITASEARAAKKHKHELTPTTNLEHVSHDL